MGWYDANPVHLEPFPPKEEARRYVEAMGGTAKVTDLAAAAAKAGDLRWAAELGNRLVMADADNKGARDALAGVYERLGEAAENALWRNMYLTAADELKNGIHKVKGGVSMPLDLIRNMPTDMLMDLLAVRLNADKVGEGHTAIDVTFTDRSEHYRMTVRNGVLVAYGAALPGDGPAELTLTLPRQAFLMLTFSPMTLDALVKQGTVKAEGDPQAFARLVSWLDAFSADFPVVWR
jgi:alkyl sulfatase BDS1-like metallo-beta-lactamase superfamily hydrolase